jgi:hypothetical protein
VYTEEIAPRYREIEEKRLSGNDSFEKKVAVTTGAYALVW